MKKHVIYSGMALVLASCSKQTITDEVDGQQVSLEVAKKKQEVKPADAEPTKPGPVKLLD